MLNFLVSQIWSNQQHFHTQLQNTTSTEAIRKEIMYMSSQCPQYRTCRMDSKVCSAEHKRTHTHLHTQGHLCSAGPLKVHLSFLDSLG